MSFRLKKSGAAMDKLNLQALCCSCHNRKSATDK
ncbi:HNH endonuclease [Flavobacterium sp. '19STA2R22 D10 B1']